MGKSRKAKKRCNGIKSQFPTLEDKIFCVILYYRTYVTHFWDVYSTCTAQMYAGYSRK
jgi:hypothetical protein